MSYPNLNSICDEDFQSSDDQTVESSEENKDSFHSSRCSSNPDISINVRELILDDNTVRSETVYYLFILFYYERNKILLM